MAKQTEIAYEPTKEWADFQTGGTRIDAADLNNMEQGISDACAAVDQLRTKRLPTYLVAQDGDTATQDLYLETILGPCLILDLAERATYYDNGEDGEGHERTLITSGADIDALRDSLSHLSTINLTRASFCYFEGEYGTVELWFRVSENLAYALTIPTDENTHAASWGLYKDVGGKRILVRSI